MTQSRLTVLTSTMTLGLVFVLALAGCSGTTDDTDSLVSAQPLASNKAGTEAKTPEGRGRGNPIERFDANKNGKLEISELPARAQERLGNADTNGDGVITKEELEAGRAKHQAERFAKTDSNGDGQLTEAEVGNVRWNHMKVADANSDGKVSREELDAARAQGKIGPPEGRRHGAKGGPDGKGHAAKGGPDGKGHAGRGQRGERAFQAFDANKDGKLEKSEVPDKFWEHVSVADANADGAVTQAEMDAAHENGTLKPPRGRGRGQGPRGAGQGRAEAPGSSAAAQ